METSEQTLIVSMNQKLIIAPDEESLLWCHPPYSEMLSGGMKPDDLLAGGKAACGIDVAHCEVSIFLERERDYYQRRLSADKTVVVGHYASSIKPLTISPCLMCPYCRVHVFMLRGRSEVAIPSTYRLPQFWEADGSFRSSYTEEFKATSRRGY